MGEAEKTPEEFQTNTGKWKAFLWSYLRRYRLRLAFGVAFVVARDLIGYTIPLLISIGIDTLAHSPRETASAGVALVSLGIAAAALPRFAFQTAARLSLMSTSRNIEYEMRRDLMRHFFALDASFWSRTRVGDAMAHAVNDLNAVRMMVGPGATALFEGVTALPVALAVMGWVNWHLTLAALLPLPFAFWALLYAGRMIRHRFDAIQSLFSTMSAAVQQTVSGVRVVRAFVQEQNETSRFDEMNRSYAKSNRELALYSSSLDPMLAFATGLSVLIVLGYGGRLVLEGSLSVGDFVMFTTYMALLSRPVSSLGRAVNLLQRGAASVARLHALFAQRPKIVDPGVSGKDSGAAPVPLRELQFDDVSVSFGKNVALAGVSLRIPFGSTVAILGPTGAGKTTLARLIPRLLDPSSGCVRFDGRDVRDMPLEQLRSQISLASQETYLFSATLGENIAMGAPSASASQIAEAAQMAGLEEDLRAFPLGLQTIVGERGVMLSGGQKQRVALARALLRRPRILVLDDTLSRVDAVTADFILRQLRHASWSQTTVFIATRIAAARHADHIVILSEGRVVEAGRHDELLASNSYYARMARLQNLEHELATL
ncbi:ABC transporter related protein [Rhodomicrobium vannielii ATCC 17100]|uniref:ABC transporter related protein n=2 Tax=Rhodomicrobium vannielii TaxID=1069 RepID=E3I4W8_RHOVT|nr:ABC transporter related protein [Rhodomicrobium vannielii ATCC 17100]